MFGSEGAASFTVDSATRITAVSPAGTLGSVHVTVTTPEGTSAPGPADRFLYGASDDQPVSVTLTIRPTTLNTGSKGVFTVYVTLYGEESAISPVEGNSKPVVDFNESYLACSGSEMIRSTVSNKNGGTLIAKFHRQDLEEVTSGDGVEITCSGTLFVNGEYVDVEGSDTIRVIGEKKGLDRIFSDLMKYLGLEEDDGAVDEPADGTVALPVTLNPDDYKNAGQMKKALKNTVIPEPAETGQNDADTAGDLEQDTGKNNGNAKKIKDENAGDTSSRGKKDTGITSGNRNTNKDDDTPRGNPNNNKNR
jgi:hypothetical protein